MPLLCWGAIFIFAVDDRRRGERRSRRKPKRNVELDAPTCATSRADDERVYEATVWGVGGHFRLTTLRCPSS